LKVESIPIQYQPSLKNCIKFIKKSFSNELKRKSEDELERSSKVIKGDILTNPELTQMFYNTFIILTYTYQLDYTINNRYIHVIKISWRDQYKPFS
jgi:hypothetical protein